jgi:hypothetical protein
MSDLQDAADRLREAFDPPRIVHVQTTISVSFGVIEGDDVTPQQPITLQLYKFAPEAFAEAYAKIVELRDTATAGLVMVPPAGESPGETP